MPKNGPLTQPSFYNGQTGPCTDVHLCTVAWHATVLCVGRPGKGDICLIDPHLCAAPLMPARWPCVTASTSGQGPRSAPLHASANRPGTGSTYCARKSPKLRRPTAGRGVLQMWCHILRKEVANAAAPSATLHQEVPEAAPPSGRCRADAPVVKTTSDKDMSTLRRLDIMPESPTKIVADNAATSVFLVCSISDSVLSLLQTSASCQEVRRSQMRTDEATARAAALSRGWHPRLCC